MDNIKFLKDFEFDDKRVLLRVDLNVPVVHGKIVDYSRIERVVPTIKYLLKNKAKVIILSHFGRPKGKYDPSLSLAPIVDALNKVLGINDVKFCVDTIGEQAERDIATLKKGEIILLENLRFYPGEENNNADFVNDLAALGDIYVNDTFSCSHRKHASIYGLAKKLPAAMGLLFQEEIENLENVLLAPKKPLIAIVGGSKVSTKINLLQSLILKADYLVIGGGMANSFLRARGYSVGSSLCEENLIDAAKEILKHAQETNCEIILPIDVIVADKLMKPNFCKVVDINNVLDDEMILDIGPKSVNHICQKIDNSKTLIWNGPVGAFEYAPFNIGTESIARYIAYMTNLHNIISVAGGGDVVAALKNSGLRESFSYLSTAGGAFLEWLQGDIGYGMKALQCNMKITKAS
jgi:phosphoglycerate kinase